MSPSSPTALPPPAQLLHLVSGFMVTQTLAILAELDVAEHLAEGPMAVSDLASRLSVDADALARFLRGAASVGVFAEVSPGVFGSTPLADLLRESARPSLRHIAILFGSTLYRAWGNALYSLKTGKPAFPELFGMPHFEYLGKNPGDLETFSKAMAGAARARIDLIDVVDWSSSRSVVDIGGGDGTLVAGLLAKHAHIEGIVFDLPELADAAATRIAESNLGGRARFQAGSFLTTPPPAADAYVLAKVLHNWSDADSLTILRHCRSVAAPGARLVVIDDIIREDNEPQHGKLLDLQMLVILGGRERTETELKALLARAGFTLTRVVHDPRGGVIEAIAV